MGDLFPGAALVCGAVLGAYRTAPPPSHGIGAPIGRIRMRFRGGSLAFSGLRHAGQAPFEKECLP